MTGLAQPDLNSVSVSAGAIRVPTISGPHTDSRYAIYPGVALGGNLTFKGLHWLVEWGYWTDGVTGPTMVDQIAYSYSGHIIGVCIEVIPADLLAHWPLPIALAAGVAHHAMQRKYVGGFGIDGSSGRDDSGAATTLQIGVALHFRLAGPLGVNVGAKRYVPFGSGRYDDLELDRSAYTAGLSCRI